MTAPTLERHTSTDGETGLVALTLLWTMPAVGFVLALLGLG